MIGDFDRGRFYGDIHWVYWSIYVDDIKLGEKSLWICSKCIISLDTETTFMIIPKEQYESIINLFDSDYESLYKYPDIIYVY